MKVELRSFMGRRNEEERVTFDWNLQNKLENYVLIEHGGPWQLPYAS